MYILCLSLIQFQVRGSYSEPGAYILIGQSPDSLALVFTFCAHSIPCGVELLLFRNVVQSYPVIIVTGRGIDIELNVQTHCPLPSYCVHYYTVCEKYVTCDNQAGVNI